MQHVASSNREAIAMEYRTFEFQAGWMSYVPWHELPRVDPENMRVIRDLIYDGGNKIITKDDGLPFLRFLATLPNPKSKEAKTPAPNETPYEAKVEL